MRKRPVSRVFGILSIMTGCLLILLAAAFLLRSAQEDQEAGRAANELLAQAEEQIAEGTVPAAEKGESLSVNDTEEDAAVAAVSDETFAGILEIPAIGLELPVYADYSMSLLKTAPCVYYSDGDTIGESYAVLCGHNYTKHFGGLHRLTIGAEVDFTDMSGMLYRYQVSEVLTIEPDDLDSVMSGDCDLSLFTCTLGGENRVLVRCQLIEWVNS